MKKIALSLLTAAAVLTGGCAYLDAKQGQWIFNPVQGEWRGMRNASHDFTEHWIPVGQDGETLHAWWSPAASPDAPVLLYLHGARWNLTGSVSRIPRWNKMGFSVLAIDYRGFGKSAFTGEREGSAPTEKSAYEDAEAAWAYLSTLAPTQRKFLFGHSLGGAMATHLAVRHPEAAGLILEGSFTSVVDMVKATRFGFLPLGFLVSQRFDNMDRIDDVKVPVLIAHGTEDAIVPYHMGEKLYAAATAKKRLFRAEGGSHHNLSSTFFEEYRKAVHEHFGLGGGGGGAQSAAR